MSSDSTPSDTLVKTTIHDPSGDVARHEEHHAHSPEEEIAHAKHHAIQNIGWFIGFFCLILLAVANYEFSSANNYWIILSLGAARCLLIAFFMNWLFREFSLIFRTFLFTILFFGGMVFLSWWDSELPHLGNPITLPPPPAATSR
ncbi:MAG: hypothetical protein LV480_09165 [Methylacidiphilales bacterium]|nr:hypothetical protein [Candidatus Methylacidiphilales bacterium]